MAELTTGAAALATMLEEYGVTHLFHVPAVLRRTMVEIERLTSIKRVRPHGEKPAAYMADGYARATGKPGICAAQVVGALNLAAGLRDAHLAHSPVIALTGGRDPHTKFRQVYQEVDDVPAFEPVTKWNATIDAVERIPDMVRQAFRVATTGAPGPVHLQFAGNEGQLDAGEAEMDTTVETSYSVVPPFRPQATDDVLAQALAALATAERPVIVAGGGVKASGAGPQLVALAERLRIPVATSLNGKDTIPGTHPLSVGVVGTYSRGSANTIVGQADLVFFIGSETGGMTTHFWKVPPLGRQTIQLDIEPEALGRNYPPVVAINADARTALARMLELAGEAPVDREGWVQTAGAAVSDWRDEYAGLLGSDQVPIRPERLCAELTDLVPDDGIVVVDTGHAGMWMGGMYDVRTETQSYVRSAGHLGWAFPAALGAKCGAPDRPVVCFTGDSGFWYHVGDVETAVRWGINTITVVNDNHSGNQSKRGFDRVYGGKQSEKAREMWVFTEVDFAAMANQIGALGIRVKKPSDLASAFDQALSSDRPVVIDVVTDIDALAPVAVEPGA
ncbi:MAG TPA: thiamine pyrophosphate-binding protein [Acidimicrobiia bacterium]|nr:thiamine pyrophosphate-binding protein [Acidimicrobiia bacterium]